VAKHGNRSITSKSGSADVLRQLGVNVEANLDQVQRCLDDLGICFCYAPLMHPAMQHVSAVRRRLGVPTIFNLLGPLCNPAQAAYQLLGVGRPELQGLLAAALGRLGTEHAVVVSGSDGLDEVTLAGATNATEVTGSRMRDMRWEPADFGIRPQPLDELRVSGPEASAAMIREVLSGKTGPARDIVLINSAAALWTARPERSLAQSVGLAQSAIDSGAAQQLLAELVRTSYAT
jgi:anthranilate phosphoribosyltransferase